MSSKRASWHYVWSSNDGYSGTEYENAEAQLDELQNAEAKADTGLVVDMIEIHPRNPLASRLKRGDNVFVGWANTPKSHSARTRVMSDVRVRKVQKVGDRFYVFYTFPDGAEERSITWNAFRKFAAKAGIKFPVRSWQKQIKNAAAAELLARNWPSM